MEEETNNPAGTQQPGGNTPPAIDYAKIESMISKGTQQKESAILESYFKQLGMSGEEVQTAVQDYKSKQASAVQQKEADYTNAQQKIAQLEAQILQSNIQSRAKDIALDLGVDKNAVPYVIKMADMQNAVNEKGEISAENLKAAIEKVLSDVPALKGSPQQNSGFVQIGGTGTGGNQSAAQNEVLANIFGTNRKKGSN